MSERHTLAPCPFCGGEAQIGQKVNPKWFFVNCTECMVSTNVLIGDSLRPTQDEAISAWNRRAQPPINPKPAVSQWTEKRDTANWLIFGEG